jgi:hypothetical protein
MVERKSELKRRYHRKHKLSKLKRKLGAAKTDHDRDAVIRKIQVIAPGWAPAAKA